MTDWQPIETAPKDGTKIDLWLEIYASPRSFGMTDAFRVPDAWYEENKWMHKHQDGIDEIFAGYITRWMPLPGSPK